MRKDGNRGGDLGGAGEAGFPDLEALLEEVAGTFERLALRRHRRQALKRARARLLDIAPRDAVEGMLAVQLVVAHEAALDASARSLDLGLSDEARRLERRQAEKLQKLCLQIVAALDKHRRQAAQGEQEKRTSVRALGPQSRVHQSDAGGASEADGPFDGDEDDWEDDRDDEEGEHWVAVEEREGDEAFEDEHTLEEDAPLPGDPRARRAVLQERERARKGARPL